MTNGDKYLKDGVDSYKLYEEFDNFCLREMVRHDKGSFKAFMGQSVKPTLTEDEKVILRSMPFLDKVIRDQSDDIWFYYQEAQKYGERGARVTMFNHLFKFIRPRRRI